MAMPLPSPHTDPALPADSLPPGLTLHISLHRPQALSPWSAELRVPGAANPLVFGSLPALIAFLVRLDPPAPGRGLR